MSARQFCDWQTAGGADDAMRLVDALERADIPWCALGRIAVNQWAAEPIVTREIDFAVTTNDVERATQVLEEAFLGKLVLLQKKLLGRSSPKSMRAT